MLILKLALASFKNTLISVGQTTPNIDLKSFPDQKLKEAITNLHHFLTLQNDGHFQEPIEKNKQLCNRIFTKLNFRTRTLKTEGDTLLFAEKIYHKNRKSILFYVQVDGRPVDTSAWSQPDPVEPVLMEFKN
ncbi:hypothetical protein ACNR9Q_08585 [Maribacter sp. X9]|uniref:hypothetical protein n=1 Tax=Maribacter sp. X9 TaxID=3402159 RepID=UPI003AF37665